jgi:hypothetical protein
MFVVTQGENAKSEEALEDVHRFIITVFVLVKCTRYHNALREIWLKVKLVSLPLHR